MNLTETLQYYRKRQGLSQIELADALEVSRQTVSKWETGAALPSAENLLALSRLYGITVDALLNEGAPVPAEETPELVPAAAGPLLPSPPAPEPVEPPRRKLLLRMLAVLLPCDLLFFFVNISWYANERVSGFLSLDMLFQLLSCCFIGLFFAWQDRRYPVKKHSSLLIAVAALLIGWYPNLFSLQVLWRMYDFITGGIPMYGGLSGNPVRLFIGFTLCDEWTILSHAALAVSFQLSRLWFARRKTQSTPRPQAVHQL